MNSNRIKRWLFSLGIIVASAVQLVAEPAEPEASVVYAAGGGGYHTYRIPVMVVATNGNVLAFCEGRKNGAGDSGKVDLVLKRSEDNGGHWSDQQIIWSDRDNCCGNPAPVVDQATGVIWLLATWNAGQDKEAQIVHRQAHDTRRVYLIESVDNGLNWSKPKDITKSVKKDSWDWYATGPVNGIQMVHGPHAGRLIIPCNHSELDAQGKPVSYSHVIYSDDHGATWHVGGVEDRDTNESTITELSDGTLMHNMRITGKQHRRAVATSNDGGMTWSPVRFDNALIEPVCEGNILRYTWPEDGNKSRILFSNPASLKRENLTVRVSYDEGTTWSASKVIYAGPSAYSCMTVLPDHAAGILFECGVKNSYETIKFARLPEEALDQ